MVESDRKKRLTRKQRKELGRRIWSGSPGLDVVHRDAAGIDIGSREHYVAVGPDRDGEPVRVFGCFTEDLHRMAEWLKGCEVKTVVLQSTGVYWIPVYDVLEQHGLDVWLVNARETRNLPGRKSDVQESQWLLKLHTYGLLRKSFRPPAEIRALRTCWRERSEYVQQAGTCIQRMQKALTEMNVQLSTVLSDLSGATGMSILRSIAAGERDGQRLAAFRDPRVKASQETIAKSLEGTWLPEQLAILQRQLADWDHVQKQIAACDLDLQTRMKQMPAAEVEPAEPPPAAATGKRKRNRKKNGKASKNEPNFDLAGELTRVAGVDLTRLDGIKVEHGSDGDHRGGTGHEQVADRGPLRILDRVGSQKRHQRRQGAQEENPQGGVASGHRASYVSQHAAPERQLSGRTVPPSPHPAGSAQSDYRHGGQTGAIGVPDAQVRTGIRGQRHCRIRREVP